MNPEVQELISRVLANEMPIDVFYARMGQLGVLPSEAQTMLSQAAGGTPQGVDPALESNRSEPINRSAYNYAPPQTATVMRDEYAPRESIMDKLQRGPLARMMGVTPPTATAPAYAGNGPGANPAGQAGPAQFASLNPMAPSPETTPAAPYAVQRFEESGSPYLGSPYAQAGDAQRFRPMYDPGQAQRFRPESGDVQQALEVAKRNAPQRQVSSAQTSAPQQQGPQSGADMSPLAYFIRGRFGEAGAGSPFDDRLTAYQEARDRQGDNKSMASGGQVNSKGGKGDAVHKALEIIQQLLSNR